MAIRAAAAGALAFLLSLLAELAVLGFLGESGEVALAIAVAPVVEEIAKRLAMLWLGASWALTGLAFGVIEGGFKLAEWHGAGAWGALASVLQHAAYGRFAAQRGLGLAIGLHAGFNTMVILGDLALEESSAWLAPVAAALLLLASFRARSPQIAGKKDLDRGVDGGAGRP